MTVNNFCYLLLSSSTFGGAQSPKLNELLRRLLIRVSASTELSCSLSRAFIYYSYSRAASSLRVSRRAFLLSSAESRLLVARDNRSNFSGISTSSGYSVALVGLSLRLNKPSRSPPRVSSILRSLNSFCFFWSLSISYYRRFSCLVSGILYLGWGSASGWGFGSGFLTGSTTSGSGSGAYSGSGFCTATGSGGVSPMFAK